MNGRRPLEGVRVLDLTRALAGPFATMALGDLGADVMKVEPLDGGDMCRGWGPFDRGVGTYFLSCNRNKRSIAVDFRRPEGIALIREAAARCDVVVENFRPGTMDEMGLGYERLREANAGLVYAAISGFGHVGAGRDWPGMDQVAQAYSGLMSVTGPDAQTPTRVGVAIGDLASGMWLTQGILAALLQRHATGLGQRVDTSLLASLVGLLSVQAQRYLSLGDVPVPIGNDHPVIAPAGVFRCADAPLTLSAATPAMWLALCAALDRPQWRDDARYADNEMRVRHRHALTDAIESCLRAAPRAHWIERLRSAGIPAGPIHDIAGVFSSEPVRDLGLLTQVQHAQLGALAQVRHPVTLSSAVPGSAPILAPPLLGEHTRSILETWSIPASRAEALLALRVVRQHAVDPS